MDEATHAQQPTRLIVVGVVDAGDVLPRKDHGEHCGTVLNRTPQKTGQPESKQPFPGHAMCVDLPKQLIKPAPDTQRTHVTPAAGDKHRSLPAQMKMECHFETGSTIVLGC